MSNLKIEPCPKTGEGVNAWVNTHVLRMLRGGYTNRTIYMKLISYAEGCGRDIRGDITHSIETGRSYLGLGKGFGLVPHQEEDEVSVLKDLPALDIEYQIYVLEQNREITLENWLGPKQEYNSLDILRRTFGENRICIGYRQSHAIIDHLTQVNSEVKFNNPFIKLGLCQFIVPTPMVGDYAKNKTGKLAIRCLANTCQRWNLVIEFDRLSSLEDQIRLHYELAKIRELRMLVFSGNKSIHGWYDVYRKPEKESKKLMKIATKLGADPMTWIRCQYVRFPGGVNTKTQQKQEILYYNYHGK